MQTVEINLKQVIRLGIISGIIYILTSTPWAITVAGYHLFDFPFKGSTFDLWIFTVGQAAGGVLVYWALKTALFSVKYARYIMDFYMELSVIDFIHCAFFSYYTYYWTQTNYILCSLAIVAIKLILNKYWHWFKVQKII